MIIKNSSPIEKCSLSMVIINRSLLQASTKSHINELNAIIKLEIY
jgi:hypothetical protein